MRRDGRQMVSTGFQAEPELMASIDSVAKREGCSRADAMRKLLRLGLDRYEHRERIVDALESAQQAVG